MSRFSKAFCLLLMLLLLIGGLSSPLILTSHAASANTGYKLVNSEVFTPYGQFVVNDTLVASSSSTQSLSSVTFGFPGNYTGKLYSVSAGYFIGNTRYAATTSQSSQQNNTLLVTLSLPTAIPAATTANVSLGFFVLNSYEPLTVTNYLVPMLFYPSTSVSIDNVSSKIQFPYATTAPTTNPYSFATFVGGTPLVEDWTYTSTNITSTAPQWGNVQLNSSQTDTGYVDFQNIQRTISVNEAGSVVVTDAITIKNLGLNTLTNLQFNFLPNASDILVEPSSDPPLSNVQTLNLPGGEMDLGGINRNVEPNDAITVVTQYALGSQNWNYSNGVYSVKIPNSAPVNALVDQFSIKYDIPGDFVVVNAPSSFSLSNTMGLPSNSIFSYRKGIGSAFGFALPAAGLFFIVVFLGVLALKPRPESQEDLESSIDSMVKVVEEKVSGTNDIISELKAKGENVSRQDLLSTRSRLEELRTRSASRFASLRSQLGQTSVEVQATMNTVAANDRELDRAVKDLLNNYDQFISKKMKADTLSRVAQNNERRIQHFANTVLDALRDLKSEYES